MTEPSGRADTLSPKRRALLAQRLKAERKPAAPPPIPRRGVEGPVRLSYAQERLWFLDRWQPGSPAYNLVDAIELSGWLNAAALAAALAGVLARHEALRTVFAEREGVAFQLICAPPGDPLPVIDLAALPPPRRRPVARELAAAEGRAPFDLARGPLCRARLFRLGGEEHLLVVAMHHIVADLWSFGVFVRELGLLYQAASSGDRYRAVASDGRYRAAASDARAALPELPLQYADFAVWQRDWLTREVLPQQLAYWRQQLKGAPAILELPADRPRPALPSLRGAVLPFVLPAPLPAALRSLAQASGGTPFMVLLAAYALLLQRSSGQDDLLVGSPIAGRTRRELEPLIGLFVNTLVLRADLSGDPSFLELSIRLRETTLGAYAHQDLPFERLVEDLQPERDSSRPPLVQVVFAFQNTPLERLALPGLTFTHRELDTGTAKLDLSLYLTDVGDEIVGAVEFSTDLFDATRIARLAGHLLRLLTAAAAEPGRRLSELPLLAPAERQQLLREWNDTAIYPEGPCLHQLFAAQAARSPKATAVVCLGERLTYAELQAAAHRLAHRLRAAGVGPESRVGLCVERSVAMVVGILGILAAGGAYVPLDPAYPEERLRFLLADSGIRVLLTQGALRERLPEHAVPVIDLDRSLPPLPEGEGGAALPPLASGTAPENLAYIIYTSGSTGHPKGVGVSHGNVTRLFAATAELFDFGPGDTWTLFHSHAFDFSVWEIWGALLYGGTLVVVPYWVSRSPAAFRELLERERVTVLNQTPSAFRQLIEADIAVGEPGEAAGGALSLRWVIFGGEALDLPSLAPWFARHGDAVPQLVNMYGITETTVHVTWRALGLADLASGSVIGAPLPDLSLFVLDHSGQPAPVGVPGEMHVGGGGVARGYLGRPELAAQRFVPDPFGRPGGRLYRSGDLARHLPNGDLEYLGRIDHQVKIRGFRIELGEIEAALAEHPAVRQAVVLARADGGGDRRLVAYLVARAMPAMPAVPAIPLPGIDELRDFLRRRLPEHMLPAAFVPLPALPLTEHGKVDRASLPAPERERSALAGELAPPRTPEERTLAEVWTAVLGVDRVGVGDNFFALGGDSILSLRVRALAAERGLRFALQDLFRFQTLGELARAARWAVEGEEIVALAPFALVAPADLERLPEDVEDAYPLSRLQLGMLFESERVGSTAYHNVSCFVLKGALDPAALAAALAKLAARHPVLRTSFDDTRFSEPLQLVHAAIQIPLEIADLRALQATDLRALQAPVRERLLDERFAVERWRRFDWRRPPLLRFWALLFDADSFALGVTEHHAILDGWSLASLLSDLFALYFAERDGGPFPPAPPPATAVRDFVALERAAIESAESRRFWSERLAGHTFLRLPRWPGRPPAAPRMEQVSRILPREVDAALGRFADAASVPEKSVLLAVHLRVLAILGGSADVLTGLATNGRPEIEDGERALGLFLNSLPLRLRLPAGTWTDLARATFAAEVEALPHRRVPLSELQKRESAGAPLFEVLFNYVHFHVLRQTAQVEVLSARAAAETHFALTVHMSRDPLGPEELEISLQYDVAALHPAQALSYAELYVRAFAAVARHPEEPWTAALLLSDGEVHQLVTEWNDPRTTPGERCLHELVTAQAARTPDAVTVLAEEACLSYGALDARANRLAHLLCAAGVGPEERVGLCVERSLAIVVGILAIHKAGGAYVPLDPAYPEERLRFLLADSGIRVLLTQSSLRERLSGHAAQVIDLDAPLGSGAATAPAVRPSPDNLAYVIYTSGSTGRPKGVGVSHRNVTRLFTATEGLYRFAPSDTWTLFHSHAFDFSVWEIWGALLYGGRLVVVPYWSSRTPTAFRELLAREGVTVLNQTPSAFRQLIEADAEVGGGGLALRWVIFGGEALELPSLAPWFVRHGDAVPRLINMYGITETTVHVTWRPIDAADLARGAGSVIGAALPDLALLVLDRHGQPAPLGVPGEMHVGGGGVARGYLGRPELTAERFVPDPFGRPGSRLYRSGDLARYLPNGDLEYLGRIDHQVKIRGFRIELGEIETALAEHLAVRQAVVLAREEGAGERRLVAYLVGERLPEIEELRDHLRRRLPEHMLPAAFVPLAALPLTAHGKIDRAALPAPERERSALAGDFVPPRTAAERALAEVWSQVLGVDRVGMDDNFFALGGDSIQSIRVRSFAAERGLRFELEDLFRSPTIAELAQVVEEAAREEATALAPFALVEPADRERLPEDVEDAYPPSLLQLGMLFHSERAAGSTVYHNVSCYTLRGTLDPAALEATLAQLAARHPVLRTSFDTTLYSEPLQLVHRATRIPLKLFDLRALPPAAREREVAERFAAERRRRFDWRRPPLLRLWVLLLTDETCALGVTEHHAIVDGWSFATLLAELFALYFAELGRGEPLPPPPAAVFRDFVALERQALESEESRRYWSDKLAGHAFLGLPRWPGRPQAPAPRMEDLSRALPMEVDAALGRLADALGVPVKSVLLAAHLRVLGHLGGSSDVLTGLVANGRPEVENGERALGLFLNTIPLRLALTEGSWSDLVRAAFAAELEALPHRRVPLAEIQRRESGGAPLFEAIFNYIHFHVLESTAGVEVLATRTVAETNFALTVNLSRSPVGSAGLEVLLQFDAAELDRAQALSYGELYARALAALARAPERPWAATSLLSEGERHQLLAEWNDTARRGAMASAGGAGGPYLHQLFEAQVERSPEAVAVLAEAGALTYRALDRRSNQLARWLRANGVGAERIVGVLLDRSLEMVVALLGVLKAGGAYLPLEPSSPPDRLGFVVADAAPRLVLTVSALAARVPAGCRAVCLDAGWTVLAAESGERPAALAGADHLAYVIYTSGSTGRPKGAMNAHRGVVNRLRWIEQDYGLAPGARLLQKTPFGFDVSVGEIFWPLATGACLVMARPEGHRDPAYLIEVIEREGITNVHFVPSMLRAFLAADGVERCAALARVLASGEELPAEAAARLLARLPGIELHNLYGPTEAAVEVAAWTCRRAGEEARVPIGRPIANLRLHLLGAQGEPTPVGTPGELHIGGVGVGRGYLGRPELTAERFVPDPFCPEPGGRLYRTGDLASARPDGAIVFLGRLDHQVKIRGYRVELGEIEAALEALPRVRQAAVVARQRPGGDLQLVAYLVTEPQAPTTAELRRDLSATLPDSMLPAAFVFLPALPLTASGKVDRRALPEPAPAVAPERAVAPPRDAIELRLVQLWEELLDVRPIGIQDDFFALGGHSLLALGVIGGVERLCGRKLPLSALLEAPTVERLAHLLRADAPREISRSLLVPMAPRGARPPLFCVHPVGGNVLCYLPLARQAGLYGIQSPAAAELGAPWTVERMAEVYLSALRAVQPEGPYLLAGWSLGGMVAYEMARQLAAAGSEVALLAMIDVAPPERSLPLEMEPGSELSYFLADLRGLAGRGLEAAAEAADPPATIEALLERAEVRAALPPDTGAEQVRELFAVFRANLEALLRYRPRPYGGRLTLIRAEDTAADSADGFHGWTALAGGGTEIHVLPGDHYSLLQAPQVAALSALLEAAIERALAGGRPGPTP
jgi:amino acid adenylation domain-containing protein